MVNTPADLYRVLCDRHAALLAVGDRERHSGNAQEAETIYRSCIVLAASTVDAYVRAFAVDRLAGRCVVSQSDAQAVAAYIRATNNVGDLYPTPDTNLISYHLSFKTYTTAEAIDKVIEASGESPVAVWKNIGISAHSRESRIRMSLNALSDRRNQIAHEGDWDPVALEFRPIDRAVVLMAESSGKNVVSGLIQHW